VPYDTNVEKELLVYLSSSALVNGMFYAVAQTNKQTNAPLGCPNACKSFKSLSFSDGMVAAARLIFAAWFFWLL
jgi:hypothetical protein